MQLNTMPKCTTFSSTGCATGCATKNNAQPRSNRLKNRIVVIAYTQGETYLSTDEACAVSNCHRSTINRQILSGKIKVVKSKGNGGDQYLIPITELAPNAQVAYWSKHIPQAAKVTDGAEIEIAMQRYAAEPEYNRKKADKYAPLMKLCEGKKGKEIEKVLEAWNAQNPESKVAYRSIKRMQSEYAKNGMDALVAKYGKTRNQNRSIDALGQIGIQAYEMFCSLYMGQGAPSVHSCWMATYGYAKTLWAATHQGDVTDFDEIFPVGETFLRSLERQKGESAIYLARYGDHAWNQKYGNFINRDYSAVKAGECWVSDHRQLDQIWRMPDGKLVRPWFTCWICFKTQKVLSWSLHADAPRADHVIDTFVSGVERWGVPSSIYIDNGKDYRCLDFAGGRRMIKVVVDERKTRSLLTTLGVTTHFAIPYNAQTKPIERLFLVFKEWLDKPAQTYTGGNHVERPEILEQRLKSGDVMNFETGESIMEYFIDNVLHTQKSNGKVIAGRTRDEAFFAEYNGLPRISEDSLAILRARNSEVRTIGANGIKESKLNDYYWAAWMEARKGTKIYLRRSMSSMQKAWVFDAQTDEYLGSGTLGMWNAPALAKTDLDQQVLADVSRRKTITKNAFKQLAKVQAAPDILEQLQYASLHGVSFDGDIPQSDITMMTKYDEVARTDERLAATGTDGNSILFNSAQDASPREVKKVFSIFFSE